MLNFVSWPEFFRDVKAFEKELPPFDAVCGVPRSGLFPASYIAMTRNIRLVEYHNLMQLPNMCIQLATSMLRESNPIVRSNKAIGNRLLVIDDSCSADSVTVKHIKSTLASHIHNVDVTYAAVYRESEKSQVDFWHMSIPQPRIFEWNWLRNWKMTSAMFDMDGVLCEDWFGDELNEGSKYKQHLLDAKPLYIPQVPILAVVTNRLEKYRPETEAWLKRHDVNCKYLIMHPAETPQQRREANDYSKRKADAYMQEPGALVFVESCLNQSARIREITNRPVLCTNYVDSFRLYRGK
jgi:hypothetical protein